MDKDLSHLYERVCGYSVDDPESQFTFTRRLARENGWNPDYVGRVVEEYKKFMFLAVAAGHPVTPSEQVDQAWHLHLVYTRSYWEDFCGQVLGRRVHHGPTKGGTDEQDKYRDWYERTKESYRRLLKEEPPADIWPGTRVRFGDDLHWLRVNKRRNWIISKPCAKRCLLVGLGALVLIAVGAIFSNGLGSVGALDPNRENLHRENLHRENLHRENLHRENLHRENLHREDGGVGESPKKRQRITHEPLASVPERSETRWQDPRHVMSGMTDLDGPIFGIAFVAIIFIVVVGHILFGNSCSECGRAHAMDVTGRTRQDDGTNGGTLHESQCKYCGATTWKAEDAGGCGGCGGCGCGGCG